MVKLTHYVIEVKHPNGNKTREHFPGSNENAAIIEARNKYPEAVSIVVLHKMYSIN